MHFLVITQAARAYVNYNSGVLLVTTLTRVSETVSYTRLVDHLGMIYRFFVLVKTIRRAINTVHGNQALVVHNVIDEVIPILQSPLICPTSGDTNDMSAIHRK